jgi:hypothetical protein
LVVEPIPSLMKHLYLALLFLFLGINTSNAQPPHLRRYWTTAWGQFQKMELIGGVGFTQFMGDAGGADQKGTNFLNDFDFDALRPGFLLGVRYRINHFIAARINLQYGILKGHDQYTSYEGREFRNLGFRSPLIEWGGLMEFYFLPEQETGHKKGLHHKRYTKNRILTAYIATGLAGCYFNPLGDYTDGTTYELHDLHTEGQGMLATRNNYTLTSFIIPVNLGFRFKLNEEFSIDVEFCYRKSFTDYMDDISTTYVDPSIFNGNQVAEYFANPMAGTPGTEPGSQRGDPTDPDGYMFMMFNLSWKFDSKTTTRPKYDH